MRLKLEDRYMRELVDSPYTIVQYKTLFLLWLGKPQTLTQISKELGVSKRAMVKPIQRLLRDGHIEVDRIEGRNKFYRACVNRKPPENKPDEGQLMFAEENN